MFISSLVAMFLLHTICKPYPIVNINTSKIKYKYQKHIIQIYKTISAYIGRGSRPLSPSCTSAIVSVY